MTLQRKYLEILLLCTGYFVLSLWGMSLVSPGNEMPLVWIPSGFLLGALVLVPSSRWPIFTSSIVLTSFTFTLFWLHLDFRDAAIWVFSELFICTAGATFYRAFCGGKAGLTAFSQLTNFLVLCVCILPALGTWASTYALMELVSSQSFWQTYRAWLVAIGLSILLLTPLIVHLNAGLKERNSKLYTHGKSLLMCNLFVVFTVALSYNINQRLDVSEPIVTFLSLPIICWSAIKFGLLGVITSATSFAITATQLSAFGFSFFDPASLGNTDIHLQLQSYLVVTIVLALYVALAIDKLSRVTQRHSAMASRYQMLFDNSPISLWEEDFSEVKLYLDQKKQGGVDIAQWLRDDQSAVVHCAQLVKINNFNNRTVEMFRADSGNELLQKLDQIFNLDSLDAFREELICLHAGDTHYRTEASQRRLDGELFYTHTAVNLVPGFEQSWQRVVVSVEDITQRKQTENQLRQAAAVFSNTAEGILIMDLQGNLSQVNRAFCAITGYHKDEIVGRHITHLKSHLTSSEDYDAIWQSLTQNDSWRGEFWGQKKHGESFPQLLTLNAVHNSQGRVINYIGVFSDISHIKESEAKLEFLAHHDTLTGLPNRLLFHDRLKQSIKAARRYNKKLAVVFLDVDRFKVVNDSLGHAAGDELLVSVAERLHSVLRSNDTVARLSGDEFTLIIENVEMKSIEKLMDKVINTFNEDFVLTGTTISATASVGVALFPDDGDSCEVLLKNADAAMFDAKESGRNTYHFYTADLTEKAMSLLQIEGALHSAISKGQLYLVYQPQVDLVSNRCVGVEALIRWAHPELGLISPELFIPIAERSGLIRDIGRWVIEQACAQGESWRRQGIHLDRVAVNVSGSQLQFGDLPQIVEEVLESTQFDPKHLEIEVTESFVMTRLDVSVAQLTKLKSLGVEISIDDFGTGYSSLSYLKKLPIDKLKIDQSFISGIPHDQNDVAITNTIISMAKDLDLVTIAEGVETEEQAQFLSLKGCQQVQGYYYSKPLNPEDIEAKVSQLTQIAC